MLLTWFEPMKKALLNKGVEDFSCREEVVTVLPLFDPFCYGFILILSFFFLLNLML